MGEIEAGGAARCITLKHNDECRGVMQYLSSAGLSRENYPERSNCWDFGVNQKRLCC